MQAVYHHRDNYLSIDSLSPQKLICDAEAACWVKSKETISVRLSSYVKNSKVILWGTANAQQLRISKSKKMVAAIRDRNSEIGVEFNAPKDKGLYEVEFFCEEYSAQKIMPIYSSNRLTIKVE